jgi:3-oxoacyl-[acyl-carrier-protein] synthase I
MLGRIVVTAVGAFSPVGSNAEETTAAVKAGVVAFSEYQYLYCTPEDPGWDEDLPLYVAAVPAIDASVTGRERFTQLAIPALTEVLSKAKLNRQSLANTGVYIALPQLNEATIKLGLDKQWLPELCHRMGLSFKMATVVTEGRVGVFSHIAKVIPLLQSGTLEQCIVGGVDTHLIMEHLTLLDKYWRLKSSRNLDGFIPGEAAVMLMLETEEHAIARGIKPLAVVCAMGDGQEAEIFSSEKVSTANGLTAAIRTALATKPENHSVNKIYCDFNGESYYAFELGLVMSRLAPAFASAEELCHPADCYGDIGAASGGLLIACAINEFAKKTKKIEDALLWTSIDNGKRMALLLESII